MTSILFIIYVSNIWPINLLVRCWKKENIWNKLFHTKWKKNSLPPCLHWHQQIQQQQYMKLMVLNLSFSRLRLYKAGVSGQRRTASKIIFLIITLLYHLQWNKKGKLINWLTSLPSRTSLSRTSLVQRVWFHERVTFS